MASTGEITGPAAQPRQTLAMRLAERERQRAERAERLARLRPGAGETAMETATETVMPAADDAEAALEEFLRALAGGGRPAAETTPEPSAAGSGAGPGLVLSLIHI